MARRNDGKRKAKPATGHKLPCSLDNPLGIETSDGTIWFYRLSHGKVGVRYPAKVRLVRGDGGVRGK